jgi:hypothetical protein
MIWTALCLLAFSTQVHRSTLLAVEKYVSAFPKENSGFSIKPLRCMLQISIRFRILMALLGMNTGTSGPQAR